MKMRKLAPLALGAAMLLTGLTGCADRPGADLPMPGDVSTETTRTSVFFSTGRSIFEEYRVVDEANVYEATMEELLAAMPETEDDIAIVQPTADFNSITVEDGVATIDWTGEVLDFEAEDKEKVLALAAILRTMGGFPEIEKVRFTVDGKTEGEVDGKDVEAFWGRVSLKGQPWDVIRPGVPPSSEEETASSSESSS